MRTLLAAFFAFLLALSVVITAAFGTTFVVLSTDREVVLGIDTKQGHQKNGRIVNNSKVCKVITRKSSAYAIAGDTGITNGPDLYPLVNSLASDDVTATMQTIERPVKKFLTRLVTTMSAEDLTTLVRSKNPATVVIGIEFKRTGNMRDLSFFVDQDRTIRSVPQPYANPARFFDDTDHEIAKALPVYWQNGDDLTNLVRKLLETGIKASPEDSGYPVSIVSITRSGLAQPEQPDVCKAMDIGQVPPTHRSSQQQKNK